MAKLRAIDTRLWHDNWIRNLNALDRYLFIYLLTNDKCSYCGIYELPLSIMAFESGLDERDLEKTMLPRLSPKVKYHEGWVYITNFKKYHVTEKSDLSKKGYENALMAVPSHILESFALKDKPLQAPSSPSDSSTLTSTSTSTLTPISDESQNLIEIIDSFKLINENYRSFFANKTERKAVTELLKRHTKHDIEKYIYLAKYSFNNQFFPSFISPYELQLKWSKVDKFWRTKETNDKNYLKGFDQYHIEMIRKLTPTSSEREIIEKTIGGKKIKYEFNK